MVESKVSVTDKSVNAKAATKPSPKPFTYILKGEGVISNRLYIKLRILRWSRTSIYFVTDRESDWTVPEYCRSKGYQV